MIAIFLFYNKALGKQTKWNFNKEFLHCHVACCNDGVNFILFELTSNGIDHHIAPTTKATTFIRNVKRMEHLIGIVAVSVNEPPKMKWRPLWIRSCNELSRYVAGVDIGLTWNPIHLYNKLLQYDGKRNYEVLHHWRR